MGQIIQYIPDYEMDKPEIPTPGIEPLLENDIRLDKIKSLYMDHIEIIVLEPDSWGSQWWNEHGLSSSTSPVYPMASIEIVSPEIMAVATYQSAKFTPGLPGSLHGPLMNSENYLTYPGSNRELPGEPSSSSSSI